MAELDQQDQDHHPLHQAVDPALRSADWEEELARHNSTFDQHQNEGSVPQHQYASTPPHNAPEQITQGIPQTTPQRPPASRLKKACDHCSERKVKVRLADSTVFFNVR